ncbi:MAG: DUF6504 family protein [Chloroflexota bacterium]
MDEFEPLRFLDEAIEVEYDRPPLLEKKPTCPDRWAWRGETLRVTSALAEWSDFTRRGRFARNMRPAHAVAAASRGSWGVGRFFFRVEVEGGRIFDIYYDREPKGADQRKGEWFVYRELVRKS